MKLAGFIAVVLSTVTAGYSMYERSFNKVKICRELIVLCDCLRRDFMYKSTPVGLLVAQIIESNRLKHIGFINMASICDKKPVNTPLGSGVNGEINAFLHSLGRSDTATQLDLIAGFREYISDKEKTFKSSHAKNSRLYLTFGLFSGVVTALVLV